MPVPVLQTVIGSKHYAELKAYYDKYPHIDDMIPLYFAQLTAEVRLLYNATIHDKSQVRLVDFIFDFSKPPVRKQSEDTKFRIIMSWATMVNNA